MQKRNFFLADVLCNKQKDSVNLKKIFLAVLFGWVDRICPEEPLTELFDVQECFSDTDCLPRICCPDTTVKGQGNSYCRIPAAKFDRIPIVKPLVQRKFLIFTQVTFSVLIRFVALENIMSYLQCTLPPPPVLDLFPKVCKSPLDCFPNLCCQEGPHRYCRPPKKSLLTLMVSFATVSYLSIKFMYELK